MCPVVNCRTREILPDGAEAGILAYQGGHGFTSDHPPASAASTGRIWFRGDPGGGPKRVHAEAARGWAGRGASPPPSLFPSIAATTPPALTRRLARWFPSFDTYRLRALLVAGGRHPWWDRPILASIQRGLDGIEKYTPSTFMSPHSFNCDIRRHVNFYASSNANWCDLLIESSA